MRQNYASCTTVDHETWKILFERQVNNLQTKGSPVYLGGLRELESVMTADRIPDFSELNKVLLLKSGWSIEVVPGLIPVESFFALLAERKFCFSTWIRSRDNTNYTTKRRIYFNLI